MEISFPAGGTWRRGGRGDRRERDGDVEAGKQCRDGDGGPGDGEEETERRRWPEFFLYRVVVKLVQLNVVKNMYFHWLNIQTVRRGDASVMQECSTRRFT